MEMVLYHRLLIAMLFFAPTAFIVLFFLKAPYGRYTRIDFGPSIPSRYGWILMEIPAVLVMLYFFVLNQASSMAYLFLILWQVHYVNRTFIYPFRLRDPLKPMPVIIVFSGFCFNIINAYLNSISLTVIHTYTMDWLWDPRFMIGVMLFIIGFLINQHSDAILFALRKSGEGGYKIPNGGLFRWISCPNFLGEIIEWIGWAIATWSLAGLSFALCTMGVLIPRAYAHHRWYQETFSSYPKRRALL